MLNGRFLAMALSMGFVGGGYDYQAQHSRQVSAPNTSATTAHAPPRLLRYEHSERIALPRWSENDKDYAEPNLFETRVYDGHRLVAGFVWKYRGFRDDVFSVTVWRNPSSPGKVGHHGCGLQWSCYRYLADGRTRVPMWEREFRVDGTLARTTVWHYTAHIWQNITAAGDLAEKVITYYHTDGHTVVGEDSFRIWSQCRIRTLYRTDGTELIRQATRPGEEDVQLFDARGNPRQGYAFKNGRLARTFDSGSEQVFWRAWVENPFPKRGQSDYRLSEITTGNELKSLSGDKTLAYRYRMRIQVGGIWYQDIVQHEVFSSGYSTRYNCTSVLYQDLVWNEAGDVIGVLHYPVRSLWLIGQVDYFNDKGGEGPRDFYDLQGRSYERRQWDPRNFVWRRYPGVGTRFQLKSDWMRPPDMERYKRAEEQLEQMAHDFR